MSAPAVESGRRAGKRQGRTAGAVLAALLLVAVPGFCDIPQTGYDLMKACEIGMRTELGTASQADGEKLMFCVGYLRGIADAGQLELPPRRAQSGPAPFCVPREVQNSRLIEVFVDFVRNSPEARQAYYALPVARSFSAAFPCPG